MEALHIFLEFFLFNIQLSFLQPSSHSALDMAVIKFISDKKFGLVNLDHRGLDPWVPIKE
jgi:hypothetical protein